MGMEIFENSGTFYPSMYGLNTGDVVNIIQVGNGGGGSGLYDSVLTGGRAGEGGAGISIQQSGTSDRIICGGGGGGGGYGGGGGGGGGGAKFSGDPGYLGGGGGGGYVEYYTITLPNTQAISVTIQDGSMARQDGKANKTALTPATNGGTAGLPEQGSNNGGKGGSNGGCGNSGNSGGGGGGGGYVIGKGCGGDGGSSNTIKDTAVSGPYSPSSLGKFAGGGGGGGGQTGSSGYTFYGALGGEFGGNGSGSNEGRAQNGAGCSTPFPRKGVIIIFW